MAEVSGQSKYLLAGLSKGGLVNSCSIRSIQNVLGQSRVPAPVPEQPRGYLVITDNVRSIQAQ